MDKRLKLISKDQRLTIGATDGQETLGRAADMFRYIDSNLENWCCDAVGPSTEESLVNVYEMGKDSTLEQMFGSLGVTLDRLTLTQAQIKQFVKRYPEWLKKGGNGTFFLFEVGNTFFAAAVYFFSDGRLGVRARYLTLERPFRAQKHHRLVVRSD